MLISIPNPRLAQIEAIAARSPLSQVAMWSTWAEHVKRNVGQFAGEAFYLTQGQPQHHYDRVADYIVDNQCMRDARMATWDCRYGAIPVQTRSLGAATRAWLDGTIEIDYLNRYLPQGLSDQRIIDIGAGYGRLAGVATALYPSLKYNCIDAVPISTYLCERYLAELRSTAKVLTLDEPFQADLAINIHSWNECSLTQVGHWLDLLKSTRFLFTVSHDRVYSTWSGPSFRPMLESLYTQVAPEEFNAIQSECPHALWTRREHR
jgi:hypothetical protein